MPRRLGARDLAFTIAVAALLLWLAIRYFRQPAVNVHDPSGRRRSFVK